MSSTQADELAVGGGDIESVSTHQYLNAGWKISKEQFRSTPVFVGMLGNPEANFAFNFGYENNTHHLIDESKNGWSFSITNERSVLQFIPAGTNQPYSPDIWQRTGVEPWFVTMENVAAASDPAKWVGHQTVTGRGTFGYVGDHIRLKVDGTNQKDATLHAASDGRIRLGPWCGGGVSVETDGTVSVAQGIKTDSGPVWKLGEASTGTVIPNRKVRVVIGGEEYDIAVEKV